MKKIVGIIGAMDEEVAELINVMQDKKEEQIAKLSFFEGTINECQCVVVRSGIGKVNAAMCTQILIDRFNVNAVINTGVAGGASNNFKLQIGDLVLATDAIQHDFDVRGFGFELGQIPRMDNSIFQASSFLRKTAQNCVDVLPENVKVYEGRVLSGDQFISDKEKVNFLSKTFNSACVEMEGASIAHVCYLNGVEFLIIRSISDSADGDAKISYQEFEKEAAKNSSLLTEKILKELSKEA